MAETTGRYQIVEYDHCKYYIKGFEHSPVYRH